MRGARVVLALGVTSLAFVALALVGCVAQSASAPSGSVPSESVSATVLAEDSAVIRVAVVGDSNSTGFRGTFEAGLAAGAAWAAALPTEQFEVVGGWAVDGSTTAQMAVGAASVPAADVVVIMGGTNDLAAGLSASEIVVGVDAIATAARAADVMLTAIAPLDWAPGDAVALNDALAAHANERGWRFVDPWALMRTADGSWVSGYTIDGVHATDEGYAAAGAVIAEALGVAR